jgi:hypothetical protein
MGASRLEEEDWSWCLTGPTNKPTIRSNADDRNFYKLEKWTKDGLKIERMLYAGNNLEKAREGPGSAQLLRESRNRTSTPFRCSGRPSRQFRSKGLVRRMTA